MLSNATNQPMSTVELGYMCPRGLLGPPAVESKSIPPRRFFPIQTKSTLIIHDVKKYVTM